MSVNMYISRQNQHSQRGAALIVALIMAAVIAISLTSYIRMTSNAMEISSRALLNNAAMNLAETGLEEAIWSINKHVDEDAAAWTAWTISGTNATQGWPGYDLGANVTADVRVLIQHYDGTGSAPIIIARSTIKPPRGPEIEKWIEVALVRRSLFANGLTARNEITFNGTCEVDAFDSRLGAYGAPLAPPATGDNVYSRGRAASASTSVDTFSLGNADIWGYVAIGTPDFSGLDVGPGGTVGPFGTKSGTVVSDRVATDFVADFPNPETPTAAIMNSAPANWETTLPEPGDLPASDGIYYYNVGIGSELALAGSSQLVIGEDEEVILIFETTTGTSVKTTGSASIVVSDGASLQIYTSANVAIGGNGIINTNNPESFQLWGTRETITNPPQDIKIAGNGQLNAVVYAPNADVTLNGGGTNGHVSGAVVANNINLTGGSKFHYDEALADFTEGNPYSLGSWRELNTLSARQVYASALSFAIP